MRVGRRRGYARGRECAGVAGVVLLRASTAWAFFFSRRHFPIVAEDDVSHSIHSSNSSPINFLYANHITIMTPKNKSSTAANSIALTIGIIFI
jgi:hypothetical protein